MSEETECIQKALKQVLELFGKNNPFERVLLPETSIENIEEWLFCYEDKNNIKIAYFDFLKDITFDEKHREKYIFWCSVFQKLGIGFDGSNVIELVDEIDRNNQKEPEKSKDIKQYCIPKPDDNNKEELTVHKGLIRVLSISGYKYEDSIDCLEKLNETSNKLIIIASVFVNTLRKYLEEILILAYGKKDTEDTKIGNNNYYFLQTGVGSVYFNSLRRIFKSLKIGKNGRIDDLVDGEGSHFNHSDKRERISSKKLREAIEAAYFPSGAEEILENIFREPDFMHDTFFSAFENELKNPLRMLFGAFISGDISKNPEKRIGIVLRAIKEIAKKKNNDSFYVEKCKTIEDKLNNIESKRKEYRLKETMLSSLAGYLEGRRILLIEDQLEEQCWHIVLPAILGSFKTIEVNKRNQNIGGVFITHSENPAHAIDEYRDKFKEFDIILLDLYSSKVLFNSSHGHSSNSNFSISEPVKELLEHIEDIYKESAQKDLVPVALPRVVIFSADTTGLTARTMLKQTGVSDYFFKVTERELHKSGYYSNFRNTIITALKDTVVHVLGERYSYEFNEFDKWLRQFLPIHRPLILRFMKYFRYYSAMSIVSVIDDYLCKHSIFDDKSKLVFFRWEQKVELKNLWFSYLGRANKSGPATLSLLSKSKWLKKCKEKELLPKFMSYEELREELVTKLLNDKKNDVDNFIIIFVDDFIGSGGQLESYIKKFLCEHLANDIYENLERKDSNDAWDQVKQILIKGFVQGENGTNIELHTLYAIGLENEKLEGTEDCKGVLENYELCTRREATSAKVKRELKGDAYIEVDKYNRVKIHVHIADYTCSLKSICELEDIDFNELRKILLNKNYVFITSTREKEYPCQFEPLGWKDCGGLTATYANAQGDTLPIIWADGGYNPWLPLFPRFFNPWAEGSLEDGKELECKHKEGWNEGECKISIDIWDGIDITTLKKPPCKA